MTDYKKIIAHVEKRLKTAGLYLSDIGKAAIVKRSRQKESEGGYSTFWA